MQSRTRQERPENRKSLRRGGYFNAVFRHNGSNRWKLPSEGADLSKTVNELVLQNETLCRQPENTRGIHVLPGRLQKRMTCPPCKTHFKMFQRTDAVQIPFSDRRAMTRETSHRGRKDKNQTADEFLGPTRSGKAEELHI